MSKNDIYEKRPIESTYFPKNIFIPYKSNFKSLDNQLDFQFNSTQPLPNYSNLIKSKKKEINLFMIHLKI